MCMEVYWYTLSINTYSSLLVCLTGVRARENGTRLVNHQIYKYVETQSGE
jgi:hypothetical protein